MRKLLTAVAGLTLTGVLAASVRAAATAKITATANGERLRPGRARDPVCGRHLRERLHGVLGHARLAVKPRPSPATAAKRRGRLSRRPRPYYPGVTGPGNSLATCVIPRKEL